MSTETNAVTSHVVKIVLEIVGAQAGKRISLKTLANETGLSAGTLSRARRGRGAMTTTTLGKLARCAGLVPSGLLGRAERAAMAEVFSGFRGTTASHFVVDELCLRADGSPP